MLILNIIWYFKEASGIKETTEIFMTTIKTPMQVPEKNVLTLFFTQVSIVNMYNCACSEKRAMKPRLYPSHTTNCLTE